MRAHHTVVPAKAGMQGFPEEVWIPAFAGMTNIDGGDLQRCLSKQSQEDFCVPQALLKDFGCNHKNQCGVSTSDRCLAYNNLLTFTNVNIRAKPRLDGFVCNNR
jgi:hypothetical protein